MLLSYLRFCLKQVFFGEESLEIQTKFVLLTRPKSLEFEVFCMEHYFKIVDALKTFQESAKGYTTL